MYTDNQESDSRFRWLATGAPLLILIGIMYLSAEGPSLVDLRDTREISSADSIRLGYGSAGEGEDRRNRTNGSASLALDFNRNKLHIKMGNVLLRDCDMQVLSDSAAAAALLKAWQKADSPDRVISRVHLFSAVPVLPQAGLNAISETFGMSEKLVQRYIPENMMIETAGDVSIWIITDAAGESLSTLGNIIEHVHLIWERLTGMKSVRIHLAESDAMSVFGLCLNHPKLIIEG